MKYYKNPTDFEKSDECIDEIIPEEQNEPAQPQHFSVGSILGGIFFLIFFFGSIAAMMIFANINPVSCLAVFGLYFMVFGTLGVVKSKNYVFIIMPVAGLAVAAISLIFTLGDAAAKEATLAAIPLAALGLFMLVGVLLVVSELTYISTKKKNCTEKVTAECVILKYHWMHTKNSRRVKVYCPVYKYYFNGVEYIAEEDTYTNVKIPRLHDEVDIFICPDEPYDIYRPLKGRSAIPLTIGAAFFLASLVGFYFLLIK